MQNDDEEQNGFSHIPHAEVEYPDTESSDDEYLSMYSSDSSTGSVISPLVSPITSGDNMTDSESESDVATESVECTSQTMSPQEPSRTMPSLEPSGTMPPQEPSVHNTQSSSNTRSDISTYKYIGDNFDISVKSRFGRLDSQKQRSLHYFHHMCIRDRIDFSRLSIVRPHQCLNSAKKMASFLLPSKECDSRLSSDLSVLVSRMMVSHIPYFQFAFSDIVTWHIEHKYYKEMSEKSEIVS